MVVCEVVVLLPAIPLPPLCVWVSVCSIRSSSRPRDQMTLPATRSQPFTAGSGAP